MRSGTAKRMARVTMGDPRACSWVSGFGRSYFFSRTRKGILWLLDPVAACPNPVRLSRTLQTEVIAPYILADGSLRKTSSSPRICVLRDL